MMKRRPWTDPSHRIWSIISFAVLVPATAMFLLLLLYSAVLPTTVWSSVQDPSIAPRPPMGFNNWARFMCALNQSVFTETADAMASNGLLEAGYSYINLDDCWLERNRSSEGLQVVNSTLFPDGMQWLGKYLHDRGFKFGIYQNVGTSTCGGYPGTKGHEEVDAKTFESYGVDYVKLDGCNVFNSSDPRSKEEQFRVLYEKWHKVFTALAKPPVFSESAPAYFSPDFQDPVHSNNTDWYTVMGWVLKYGELARHSTDIKVYGIDGVWQPGGHWESILANYGFENLLARYQQRCGFYNDPDFLIPFPDLTLEEKKTQFSLWATFSAPLIISAWIPELPETDIEYLTNKDIIDIDQDALCIQATLVSQDGNWDVLTKNLANGDRLLTVFNRRNTTSSTSIPLQRAGLASEKTYQIWDLWTGEKYKASKSVSLKNRAPHSTTVLRISPHGSGSEKLKVTPTGMIFNTFTLRCLTATATGAVFETCSGKDEQVWQATGLGAVTPLSSPKSCLSTGKNGGVQLASCTLQDRKGWEYFESGNLMIKGSGLCLSESETGEARLDACRPRADSQVFGLPSGVRIH